MTNPIDQDVRKLIKGLVKSGTVEHRQRSHVMPTQPFIQLFKTWPDNEELSMDSLRLKTITLMALIMMLRPSDIAPWAVTIKKTGVQNVQFTADKVFG